MNFDILFLTKKKCGDFEYDYVPSGIIGKDAAWWVHINLPIKCSILRERARGREMRINFYIINMKNIKVTHVYSRNNITQ